MPSPIRLSSRWTRKKPTVGASTPTTAPAANARRMNTRSSKRRPGGGRLRDEGALLLATGEARHRPPREVREADSLECLVDRLAILAPQPADRPERRASGLHDLPHGHGGVHADACPLREVADSRA